MVGWKCVLLLFAFFVCSISGLNQLECPSKQLTTVKCDDELRCDSDQFCMLLVEQSSEYGCCDKSKSHCVETGMHAFTSTLRSHQLHWKMDDNSRNSDIWYETKVKINGEETTAACPIPLPFQMSGTNEKITAVGFQEGGAKVKNCGKSSDCKKDEFCGHAYNPSYCDDADHPDHLKNHCLDKSNNGLPMQFCFKNPKMVNDKLKMRRDRIGFDVCNEQKDCGAESICMMSQNNDIYLKVDSNDTTDGNAYAGICLEAHFCDNSTNPIAHLPKNLRSCDLGNHASCGTSRKCVPTNLGGLNLCCHSTTDGSLAEFLAISKENVQWIVIISVCTIVVVGIASYFMRKLLCGKKVADKAKTILQPAKTTPVVKSTPPPTPKPAPSTPAPTPTLPDVPSPSLSACPTQATLETEKTMETQTVEQGVLVEKKEKKKIEYDGLYELFFCLTEENQIKLKAQEIQRREERLERMRQDEDNFFRY